MKIAQHIRTCEEVFFPAVVLPKALERRSPRNNRFVPCAKLRNDLPNYRGFRCAALGDMNSGFIFLTETLRLRSLTKRNPGAGGL